MYSVKIIIVVLSYERLIDVVICARYVCRYKKKTAVSCCLSFRTVLYVTGIFGDV